MNDYIELTVGNYTVYVDQNGHVIEAIQDVTELFKKSKTLLDEVAEEYYHYLKNGIDAKAEHDKDILDEGVA
jgi:hypothetical protein